MVADAKECSEGVSFFGVRRLLLADVPASSEDLMQRVGRAVRFMGHAGLPEVCHPLMPPGTNSYHSAPSHA